MNFAHNLRNARLSKGLTQREVAELLGITNSTYCGYEIGKRQPDVAKIKEISAVLHITADDLIGTGYATEKFSSGLADLSPHEVELLTAYRNAGEDARHIVDLALKPYGFHANGNKNAP